MYINIIYVYVHKCIYICICVYFFVCLFWRTLDLINKLSCLVIMDYYYQLFSNRQAVSFLTGNAILSKVKILINNKLNIYVFTP